MPYFSLALNLVAGICVGFGLMYLFIGLRRRNDRPLSLTFSLFALTYAGVVLAAGSGYAATSVSQYITAERITALCAVATFIFLIWYVALYTGVRPRVVLWLLTASFLIIGLVIVFLPDLMYSAAGDVTILTLPWGETIFRVSEEDTAFLPFVIITQLAAIGFILYASVRQYFHGERQEALVLGIGTGWFIFTLIVSLLVSSGVIDFIFLADFGFLGFAVVMSLQMANRTIKTESELAAYRLNLEELVENRTAELEAAQEQLLAQAQERAAAAERSRLARDLHDEVTQTIYSASLIVETLPKLWPRDPDSGHRNLVKLRQLIRGALAEMRTLLFELRPSAVEGADLGTLLQQLGDVLTGRSRIPVEVTVDGDAEIAAQVKIVLYRIAQESFNNILKHAGATRVSVRLQQLSDQVILSIQDNGRGFDPATVSADHMGLRIMHERAAEIGADLSLESEPGGGTQISAIWIRPATDGVDSSGPHLTGEVTSEATRATTSLAEDGRVVSDNTERSR